MTAKSEQSAGGGDILVQGYDSRYLAAFDHLMQVEGGYVNDPVDRGGETKFGISLRFLIGEGQIDLDGDGAADFDLDMDGDIDGADIRKLTLGDAKFLYHRCFWQRGQMAMLPRPLGEAVFDQAVNGGMVAAGKLLQRAVNTCLLSVKYTPKPVALKIDGQIGQATRKAVMFVLRFPGLGMPALVDTYRSAAAQRYRSIVANNPPQKRFLKGWLARAEDLGRWAA
ncbi:MAG: glycosyl hydrolase 108 family protein [Pseudomonadota bacterium]|nr:glycosyl hydrolase 108 family protein [Pseudomonadota bacterium]